MISTSAISSAMFSGEYLPRKYLHSSFCSSLISSKIITICGSEP